MPNAHSRQGIRRALAWLLGSMLTLSLLLALLLSWVLYTDSGTQTLWRASVWLSQGQLRGQYLGGTLAHGLQLRDVRYGAQQVRIDRIDARWHFALTERKLSIDYLHLGQLAVKLPPSTPSAAVLPPHLRLPLALAINDLRIQELRIEDGDSLIELSELQLRGNSDRLHHSIQIDHLRTAYGQAHAQLSLNGARPFAVQGALQLNGAYQAEHYRIAADISGSLAALSIALKADGDKLNGTAAIDLTPFDAVLLQRAQVAIDHVNPKTFNAAAPQADLTLRADLKPDGDAAVSGNITIRNANPGALDQDRLPLHSISANLTLNAQTQDLHQLAIKLNGGGVIEGSGSVQATTLHSDFKLKVSGLDLHALHRTLRSTRLHGPLTLATRNDSQQLSLLLSDLNNGGLSAELDVLLDAQQLHIRQARLSQGKALLNFSATLAHDDSKTYSASGSLSHIDPALFLAAASQAPHADINLDFDLAGALTATPSVKLRFGLRNSSYGRLPLSGKGTLALLGSHLQASDISLSVAGNQLRLQGGFGNASDRLQLHLDAPQLQGLGYGLSGLLKLDAQLSGSLPHPALRASYQAEQLTLGPYHLASLSGKLNLPGDMRNNMRNDQQQLQLQLAARGYRGPGLILDTLSADLNGSVASHELQLAAHGMLRDQALALDLRAHGKLLEQTAQADGYRWSGSIATLNSPPYLSLQTPLALEIGKDHIIVGSSRFTLIDTPVDLQQFSYQNGRIRSQGAIKALHVDKVLALLKQFGLAQTPVKTDLVLDSQWDFTLAENASGFLQIERQSGDLSVQAGDIDIALGLNTLKLRADLHDDRIAFTTALQAARIGSINGQGQLKLSRQGTLLTLTPDSALSASATVSLPQLASVGALLGPRLALRGSLALQLQADGTLSQPRLAGSVNGDQLGLTWFDQGLQLQNGSIRISMNDNIIDLQQFEFYGGKGTLRAGGQVQLGQLNPDLHANIVAEHLQLFASPDRQLVLSGQASLASLSEQLHINGTFKVEHALFDLPKSSAPTLSDDVVIVRNDGRAKQAPEKPPGRFAPVVDLDLDLGNDFRFHGGGADLRLLGALNLKSAPYQPLRGSGTVRVSAGTYETFGVKLAIERGIINFQGPLDNPNLNLLAMRRNQEVPAGVEVSGTASAPRMRLVSEPNLSEEEKLSWVMFGQGSGSGLGQRKASDDALALLGNLGGKKIAQGIGLDQFSIGSSESGIAGGQFVNLGKAISQKFMLGYEQSMTSAESVAKVTYQLSRSWSLLARAGTINSLNLLFGRRYD